jgi:predicted acyltransferase
MNKRNLAIDMFRGLTMVLMVFVNDFWTVLDVPHFLEHFATLEDGMGLSDIIYPMFLFAVGMSIPYAIDRRYEKGLSGESTLGHIFSRTFALLVMGTFICNQESREMEGCRWLWIILFLVGFFLVWNQYKPTFKPAKWLKLAGVVLLVGLAIYYRTPDGVYFEGLWWGILGQIGWAYLFCALAYLLCRGREWPLYLVWVALCLVNLSVVRMRGGDILIGDNVVADVTQALHLGNGSIGIMALGGMLLTLTERKLKTAKVGIGLAAAAVLAVLGMAVHHGWIISKNIGTLPWCLFVSAISVALYTLLRVLESKGWTGWFKPLQTAGTATLTVYMVPYLIVAFWVLLEPSIPAWLCGWVGVAKCAVYTAVVLFIAWVLTKLGIKLKI